MKKILIKTVWISIQDKSSSFNSYRQDCHYMEEPEQLNRLIHTNDFNEAFDFIKSNNFKYLSAISFGKIKIIHYDNLNTLTRRTFFKFNFKDLVILEGFDDCSNNLSSKGVLEGLSTAEFIEYCNDKKLELGIGDIVK